MICIAGDAQGASTPQELRLIDGTMSSGMTMRYAHLVDSAKKNPALFIPVKVE